MLADTPEAGKELIPSEVRASGSHELALEIRSRPEVVWN